MAIEKRLGIEGSNAAKFVQLIRKYGHNRDTNVEIAIVVSPFPSLSLRVYDGVVLESEDLIISRTVRQIDLKSGDKVIVLCDESQQAFYVIDQIV
ncbi:MULTISPECIES: hypothetical protein [Bacillus]|uniref:hypothetical protein n=1 Tax=Bacillus TaxID=1386 RepID=UPI000380FA1C|nr:MULTISPECIES: hypothetical protein [Bacillus]